MMIGAEVLGRFTGKRKLVGRFDLSRSRPAGIVADAECLHSLATRNPAHYCKHRARVQSAAEKHSERHLRNQTQPDALFKQMTKFFDVPAVVVSLRAVEFQIPVLAGLRPALLHGHPMSWLQFENV